MSTNGKVSQPFIIMLIIVPFAPTTGVFFTPNTKLLHILNLDLFLCY